MDSIPTNGSYQHLSRTLTSNSLGSQPKQQAGTRMKVENMCEDYGLHDFGIYRLRGKDLESVNMELNNRMGGVKIRLEW